MNSHKTFIDSVNVTLPPRSTPGKLIDVNHEVYTDLQFEHPIGKKGGDDCLVVIVKVPPNLLPFQKWTMKFNGGNYLYRAVLHCDNADQRKGDVITVVDPEEILLV